MPKGLRWKYFYRKLETYARYRKEVALKYDIIPYRFLCEHSKRVPRVRSYLPCLGVSLSAPQGKEKVRNYCYTFDVSLSGVLTTRNFCNRRVAVHWLRRSSVVPKTVKKQKRQEDICRDSKQRVKGGEEMEARGGSGSAQHHCPSPSFASQHPAPR